jgi:hypothetical protein
LVNDLCRDAYDPEVGRPVYEPVMMIKILFLQFLYNMSDGRVEEEVTFNLVLKWFIGLAIDKTPPDSSMLTRFRDRLDRLSIVDSTHVRAKVDTFKLQSDPGAVRDKDARDGYKSKDKPFFGY